MPDLHLEFMPLSMVREARRNPKRHKPEDIGASMERFGYVEPMVLDERTGCLVAGHGRRDALVKLRLSGKPPPSFVHPAGTEWQVPVLRGWSSKDDEEAEAYLIASNQLTIAGGWSDTELALMLGELHEADRLSGVGFDEDELNRILETSAAQPLDPEGPEVDEDPEELNAREFSFVVSNDDAEEIDAVFAKARSKHKRGEDAELFLDICRAAMGAWE